MKMDELIFTKRSSYSSYNNAGTRRAKRKIFREKKKSNKTIRERN